VHRPIPGVCGDSRSLDPGGHGGSRQRSRTGRRVGSCGSCGWTAAPPTWRARSSSSSSARLPLWVAPSSRRAASPCSRSTTMACLVDVRRQGCESLNTSHRAAVPRPARQPSPAGCATSQLLNLGSLLSSFGGSPFPVRPGALLVGVVDHGARPCRSRAVGNPGADLAKGPACWATFGGLVLHRADFASASRHPGERNHRGDEGELPRRPWFSGGSADSLEAFASYFDPRPADGPGATRPRHAHRPVRALGSDAPAQLAALASAWAVVLAAHREASPRAARAPYSGAATNSFGRAPQAGRESARGAPARSPARRNGPASAPRPPLAAVAALAWLLWPTRRPRQPLQFRRPFRSEAAASREPRKIPPRRPPPAATAAAPGVDEARVRAAVSPGRRPARLPRPAGAPAGASQVNVPASGSALRSSSEGPSASPLSPVACGRSYSPGDSTICTWRRTWICSPPFALR